MCGIDMLPVEHQIPAKLGFLIASNPFVSMLTSVPGPQSRKYSTIGSFLDSHLNAHLKNHLRDAFLEVYIEAFAEVTDVNDGDTFMARMIVPLVKKGNNKSKCSFLLADAVEHAVAYVKHLLCQNHRHRCAGA